MKNYLPKTLLLFLLLFIGSSIIAQDKIYKKNEEVIECKVTEIGEDEVKYTSIETGDVIYVIDKDRIEKIVFGTGKELVFSHRMDNPELYANQKKNAFKAGMFSPLSGATSLSYERSLKPGRSAEVSLGLIGLGRKINNDDPVGGYLKLGYKFIMTPDFEIKGMKYSHLLKGWYFKPELSFALYQKNISVSQPYNPYYPYSQPSITQRKDVVAGALMLNFGKQIIMSDAFLVDIFVGVGYGIDNLSSKDYSAYPNDYNYQTEEYHYGFIITGEIPIALSFGFKVGFLTK